MEQWIEALVGSPWVFVALYLFATIDGFFPPVPSETVVIALAALGASTGEPSIAILGAVAAAGAFSGDQIAYSIGRHIPLRRWRLLRGARAQKALAWAEAALERRAGVYIVAARYIPVGRVAVNMTAGAVRFSRLRFSGLAAIAAVSWSAYSVLLGVGAGSWLHGQPVLAVVIGVTGGLLIGAAIDPLITWFGRRVLGIVPASPALAAETDPDRARPPADPVPPVQDELR